MSICVIFFYISLLVVHKAFVIPQEVSKLYKNYHINTINKLLKNLKVICRISGLNNERSYRLDGLGLTPDEHEFPYENEENTITVTNYFLQRYKYQLQHRTWPCLVVKGQQTHLPLEVRKLFLYLLEM